MIEVDDELTIGEAARESGLSEDTLRWYERIGLTIFKMPSKCPANLLKNTMISA